jgi:hypothetical protein
MPYSRVVYLLLLVRSVEDWPNIMVACSTDQNSVTCDCDAMQSREIRIIVNLRFHTVTQTILYILSSRTVADCRQLQDNPTYKEQSAYLA